MIAAKVRRILFRTDDDNQTVTEQKLGKMISSKIDPYIHAVIAESMDEAAIMLREDIRKYLSRSQVKLDSKYFTFTIATAEIENSRFSMIVWFEHGTEYPVDNTILE